MIRQGKKVRSVTCNLFSATCLALLLAPSAALAQDECGAQSGTTPIVCDDISYTGGVTYDADGDLFIDFTASPTVEVGGSGILLTGDGSEAITFDSATTSTEIESRDTVGALLDVSTVDGDIDILTEEMDADGQNPAGVTHAIRAIATGAGNVNITATGFVDAQGGLNPADSVGIEAVANGGDIVISNTNVSGNEHDILATNTTGSISVDGRGDVTASTTGGDITLTGPGSLNAVATISGGSGNLLVDASSISNLLSFDLSASSGTATINLSSSSKNAAIVGSGSQVTINVADDLSLEPYEAFNSPAFASDLNFTGITGGVNFNLGVNKAWEVSADSTVVFSPGEDVVHIPFGGRIRTPVENGQGTKSNFDQTPVTVDFGTGDDRIHNEGIVLIGVQARQPQAAAPNEQFQALAGELRFENLETFENAGTVLLGTEFRGCYFCANDLTFREDGFMTDLWRDDILSMEGTHWVGMGDSLIVLDADLNAPPGVGQNACNDSIRQPDPDRAFHPGDMPAADCLNLAGGSASGRTLVRINQLIPGDRGAYNPEGIVIVDLAGSDPSETDPDAFAVAPSSQQYSPLQGGVVDKGVFVYTIAFDADAQQFKLYGLPGPTAQQFPLLGQAANGLWQTATDAWFDRRVDQRDIDRPAGDLGGGVWVRAVAREGERDVTTPLLAGTTTLNFDNSYTQNDSAMTFGLDLISSDSVQPTWVLGTMVGYTRSRVDFDNSRNTANFEGVHAGLYASLTAGSFYLDATVNGNWSDLDNDTPALALTPETAELSTDVKSLGGQFQAGWRWRAGRLTVEPLLGLSYVETKFDEVSIPADNPNRFGAEMALEDPKSSRGSIGVRLRLDDVAPGIVPLSVGLTTRLIEEFDGESEATVVNLGPRDALVSDTFDGTFTEVAGDVSITNAAKTAAGFLKVDGMFGDDYDSLGVSAGFRYQW